MPQEVNPNAWGLHATPLQQTKAQDFLSEGLGTHSRHGRGPTL